MAVSAKYEINADQILLSLSDGTNTLEWDVAGDTDVYLTHGAHSTEKFTSQKIKAQSVSLDGTYEAQTLTVVFLQSEAEQVETWWKNGTRLTYTVSPGSNTGLTAKSYTDCLARVSKQPTVTPGKTGYVTMQIEVSCLMNVAGTGTAAL